MYGIIVMSTMKEQAKEYYESHRVSFKWLASHSVQVLGGLVTEDQLKKWSQDDGGWRKKAISGIEKLRILEQKTFERIEESDALSTRDFTALVTVYLTLQQKTPDVITDAKPSLQSIIDVGKKLKNDLDRPPDRTGSSSLD